MSSQGIASVWPVSRPLIGMVHLGPLPGAPGWGGSIEAVIERAVVDARVLEAAGFDGLMVENFGDVPFFRGPVPAETVAGITRCVAAVRRDATVPVGVNVLRNDAHAAMGIAVATSARFIRVNVHVGSMWTDQGLIEGQAAETLRLRASLGSQIAILADIHVKHATPPAGALLEVAAADTWHRGRADALIVSGAGTGAETAVDDLTRVKAAMPDAPVLVGSGARVDTVAGLLRVSDGVIVGTSVMTGGAAGAGIDRDRARAFVEAAHT